MALQPFGSHLCFATCPSGCNPSGGICACSKQVVLDFQFDSISPTVSGIDGMTALNGATLNYYPPAFEASDPLPSKHRGYYFSGSQYLQLPPATGTSGSPLLYSICFTFSVWIRPQGSGIRTIYSKQDGYDEIFTIQVTTDNKIKFVGGNSDLSYEHTKVLNLDSWVFVGITFDFNSATGATLVTYYYDGVLDSTYSNQFYVIDTSITAQQVIGASSKLTNFYYGFIWRLKVSNFISTDVTTDITSVSSPSGLPFSLSPCPFSETPECQPCSTACSVGCVRTRGCSLCADMLCSVCQNFESLTCTSCIENAGFEDQSGVQMCICKSGFYLDLTTASCPPCDNTCYQCIGPGPSKCSACKSFAKLSGSAPNTCECTTGAYPAPDASSCALCHSTCSTCVSGSITGCSGCKSKAFLSGPAPDECQCSPGFYPDPDPAICSPCGNTCASCTKSIECQSCKQNAELKNAVCQCLEGFYWSSDTTGCIACTEGCKTCLYIGCVTCYSTFYFWNQACVTTCPKGYKANNYFLCEAVDLSPPVAALVVTSDNSLSITFDKPMNLSISASEISVEIHDPGNLAITVTWTDPSFQDERTMLVVLTFYSTYLAVGSSVNLTFVDMNKVMDEYGVAINTSSVVGILHAFGIPPSNQSNLLLQRTSAQQTAAVTKSVVSSRAPVALITGNSACFMFLVNQLQLITYISMTQLPIPPDFASALAALNVGQMLPNPVPSAITLNETSQTAPQFVQNYGIDSTLFIVNSVSFLGTSCCIILSFLPIYFLSKVKIKFIANYFGKLLPSLRWNVPVSLWLTSYLDIGIFSFLQLLNARDSVSDAIVCGSLVLAGLFAICIGATPILLMIFTYRNFSLMVSRSDSGFNRRWGFLFLSFKTNYQFSSVAYYSLFIVRRCILVFTLTLGQNLLGLLAVLNSSFALIVSITQFFLYIVICRPYESKLDQVEAAMIEGCTCVIYISASSFLLPLSDGMQEVVNQAGVWLVRLALGSSVVMSVARIYVTVSDLVKEYRRRMHGVESKYEISQQSMSSRRAELPNLSVWMEQPSLPSELPGASYITT